MATNAGMVDLIANWRARARHLPKEEPAARGRVGRRVRADAATRAASPRSASARRTTAGLGELPAEAAGNYGTLHVRAHDVAQGDECTSPTRRVTHVLFQDADVAVAARPARVLPRGGRPRGRQLLDGRRRAHEGPQPPGDARVFPRARSRAVHARARQRERERERERPARVLERWRSRRTSFLLSLSRTRYEPSPFANSGFYYLRANDRTQHLMYRMLQSFDAILTFRSHQHVLDQQLIEHTARFGLSVAVLPKDRSRRARSSTTTRRRCRQYVDGRLRPYVFHMLDRQRGEQAQVPPEPRAVVPQAHVLGGRLPRGGARLRGQPPFRTTSSARTFAKLDANGEGAIDSKLLESRYVRAPGVPAP